MREYPITVPTHVYHINSSASNIFDVDQYQRKLLTNDQPLDNNRRFHPSLATVSYPNKNHSNYNCTSNGDLSSAPSGYRVLNSTLCGNSATNYNRSNKNAIKRGNNNKNSDRFHDETANGSRATTSAGHGSYSLLDAITNAVTTANCSSTVYPLNEDEDDAAIDNADASKNASSSNRRHYLTDDKLFASNVSRCQAADQLQSIATPNHFQNITPSHISSSDEQFQRYGYSVGNNRAHQFPSVNYKNSYLLWIGTPVAARYCNKSSDKNIYDYLTRARKKLFLLFLFILRKKHTCSILLYSENKFSQNASPQRIAAENFTKARKKRSDV